MENKELEELNETRKRIAEQMPIPANYLLTKYQRFCEKLISTSEDEAYIECPHCKFKHEDWQNYGLDAEDMEGEFEMPCEECEEKFNVKFHMTIHIKTSK